MGVAMAFGSATSQGSRLVVHGHGGVERGVARFHAHDFGIFGLPRFGSCPFAASGVQRFARRPAANLASPGEAPELGVDPFVAASPARTFVADSDRLAFGPVLRAAGAQSQRNLLRPTPAGHHEISRLCHGLYRSARAPLHPGADLGPTSRNHGPGVAALAGRYSRNRPENQAFAAGSRLFQCPSYSIPARGKTPLSDAGGVPRTPAQEEPPQTGL